MTMSKTCIACGGVPEEATKPNHEAEDCVDCGAEGTVQNDEDSMDEGEGGEVSE